MAALTPPSSSDSNSFSTYFKSFAGRGMKSPQPLAPFSEPGVSRDSSVSPDAPRRSRRKVIPGLPRTQTFQRQQSENRDKLETIQPTTAERRAGSVDRRSHLHNLSYSTPALPSASAPDFFQADASTLAISSRASSPPRSSANDINSSELRNTDATNTNGGENHGALMYSGVLNATDIQSTKTSPYDAQIRKELEEEWILNVSMLFRDKSNREKFFVTYREKGSYIGKRVTISLDYRNAPHDSLEQDLLNIEFQREKSAKIYEAIRDSLQDIQFYKTVTNLKLETSGGRLHVHVVEDVNEIIPFPKTHMVEHLNCRRIPERRIKFKCHMSGFVYKVEVSGRTLIKKEIPGPDTIEEFLYEINALHSLRFSRSIIEFYGVVIDDDHRVKGLLIDYAEQGALIDIIYDCRERGGPDIPWATREKWARQIVRGLADIHEAGFVQGDFTLSNIVIDRNGDAKIIDINRRGCPVGWEPPEARPLIDSNQRITMYIGVKSDLYQLGMVLWALATLEDEPDTVDRPLRLSAELDTPSWYRRIVETCLQDNPRLRSQASALLAQFPESSYDGQCEERELPSVPVHNDSSLHTYEAEERYGRPALRNSWPYSSASHSQTSSPSTSDGRRRGRSPPSPSPRRHDVYTSPPVYGGGLWTKDSSLTVVGDGPGADEMVAELDHLAQLEQRVARRYPAQSQTPGGDSLAQDTPSKTVGKSNALAGSRDEDVAFSNERTIDSIPAHDLMTRENLERIPHMERLLRTNEFALSENPLGISMDAEREFPDDVISLDDDPIETTQAAG